MVTVGTLVTIIVLLFLFTFFFVFSIVLELSKKKTTVEGKDSVKSHSQAVSEFSSKTKKTKRFRSKRSRF